MTTPVYNISFLDIQKEFGGDTTDGISLLEYQKGGEYVPSSQQSSEFSIGVIPEKSTTGWGAHPPMSVGMFRGLSKSFKTSLSITSDRFSTYNLYNELVGAGWDKKSPVNVTLTIDSSVSVVATTTTTYAIDASYRFPAKSKLTIINHGQILGHGGKGGTGGIMPNVAGSDGENGGAAICVNLVTEIQNNGIIAGGGGGGGGSSGAVGVLQIDNVPFGKVLVMYNGASGGGGAPFGNYGNVQTNYGTPLQAMLDFYAAAGTTEYQLLESSTGTVASLTTPGQAGLLRTSVSVSAAPNIFAGMGGTIGSMGASSHNSSTNYGYTSTTQYISGGRGGQAGIAIVGMANVTWTRFGTVLGRFPEGFGTLKTADGTKVSDLLSNGAKSVSLLISKDSIPVVRREFYGTIMSQNTTPWSTQFGQYLYSYDSSTNLSNLGPTTFTIDNNHINPDGSSSPYAYAAVTVSPGGTQPKLIKYSAVTNNTGPVTAYLEGIVDDRITAIHINGVNVPFTQPNGLLNCTTSKTSGSFSIPTGPSVIDVFIADDNKGTYALQNNTHCMFLYVKTQPYGAVLVRPNEWYATQISNI